MHLSIAPVARVIPLSALLFMIFSLSLPALAGEQGPGELVRCDIHHDACTKALPNAMITLDISPKPVKAMKDLLFTLEVSGTQPTSGPYIDLGMPGMKMGPNRVDLEASGKGLYKGRGIIVRCPSGKRTWMADVMLPGLGNATFVFDVIY